MNLLLISIDALRADHLSCEGYNKETSPNIDRLVGEGVYFSNTITPVSRTNSIISLLTGLYPHSHGVAGLFEKMRPDVVTLQEILGRHNYKTCGYNIAVDKTGIEKGFSEFNLLRWKIINLVKEKADKLFNKNLEFGPAKKLTDFAIRKIKKLKKSKFFFYLHYGDLHWPYIPPEPYDNMFDPDYNGNHDFNGINKNIKRGDLIFNNSLSAGERDHSIAHYDGALKYVDTEIGRLLRFFKENDLMENTLIILCSDHGESLGDHGLYYEHGEYIYDESLRVPLVLKAPNLPTGLKRESLTQLVDVFPTVLDILGIPLIDNIDGVSLMPLIKENKNVRKYAFAESGESYFKQNKRRYIKGIKGLWRMIRTNEWKLIYIPHPKNDIYELYNIKEDSGENTNLIDRKPDIAEKLKKELFKWINKPEAEQEVDLNEKSKKLLKKLGYMD